MTDKEIVEGLAKINPGAPSEIDGCVSCFFCHAYLEPHDNNCLWRQARMVVEGITEEDINETMPDRFPMA